MSAGPTSAADMPANDRRTADMHVAELRKPDGRSLTLYGRAPLDVQGDQAPSPFADPLGASPHLRWHPLRGEWVTYAAYRQDRTFLPPPAYNPLAPTIDSAKPTEVPAGNWDVAVFDNRFPSLAVDPSADNTPPPSLYVSTAPATGHCEVVVYAQDPGASLSGLPLTHVELLLKVWGDRTERLSRQPGIAYVLPFENRGQEVGVTLHHPHGQIYAYPVVPPVAARMQAMATEYFKAHSRGLLEHMSRANWPMPAHLVAGPHAVASCPCVTLPYEVW